MKKVEAKNAECRQGMIATELAFIKAGHLAANQTASEAVKPDSSPVGILQTVPVAEGFFADNAATRVAMAAAARQ